MSTPPGSQVNENVMQRGQLTLCDGNPAGYTQQPATLATCTQPTAALVCEVWGTHCNVVLSVLCLYHPYQTKYLEENQYILDEKRRRDK